MESKSGRSESPRGFWLGLCSDGYAALRAHQGKSDAQNAIGSQNPKGH